MRFLLGPAGSGKTFRCLSEIRRVLENAPDGPPLLLLAPKQGTYQLERQLLSGNSLSGYSRLHVLSFERLAHFSFAQLGKSPPAMLDEEGRIMVLRGLLARKRDHLKLFRASARLTGFAQQLSLILSEIQQSQLSPERLNEIAARLPQTRGLSLKLQDLATLLQDYQNWLEAHSLQDADSLLKTAARILNPSPHAEPLPLQKRAIQPELFETETPAVGHGSSERSLQVEQFWVDGFAEFSHPELELLAALQPNCQSGTITFCLENIPSRQGNWLSSWSIPQKTFQQCKARFEQDSASHVVTEVLPRKTEKNRFQRSPILQHLERAWTNPSEYEGALDGAIRVVNCKDPEAEVTFVAREILQLVRAGSRYRDISVLVRSLDAYHVQLRRTFARYNIPFFLDRRESVSHHPLAELTRNALRTVINEWESDHWFAALKTGLVRAEDTDIDKLENEALARGWRGSVWQKPIVIESDAKLTEWLSKLLGRILPPFQRLALSLAALQGRPNGPELSETLRTFWKSLNVEEQLQGWAAAEISSADFELPNSVHGTVWEQMLTWLENVELAFPTQRMSLREWLPILEAGLANLTVGIIPPALDQVLVGSLERSRNPDITTTIVLGMNEGVFPAAPQTNILLSENDRQELERQEITLGGTARAQLGRERYLAYIACTRPRERLLLTYALNDLDGSPMNPSPFLAHVKKLFPGLEFESAHGTISFSQIEHPRELIIPLLRMDAEEPSNDFPALSKLRSLPAVSDVLQSLRQFQAPAAETHIPSDLAKRLYGSVLHSSVSRLEQFAACPFRFFVHSGLRAEERKTFELDLREQGSFQHDVLALFHEELHKEKKRWRDISPEEARKRIDGIARTLMLSYREGLLQVSEQSKFMARILNESLQDFVETLVRWMREQYEFDPVAVELSFGWEEGAPAWEVDLGNGSRLALFGRIDRVDLYRDPNNGSALCVVLDYKSSHKQLESLLMENGLQLQLLVYLNVIRAWPHPEKFFGVNSLRPAGVFYVNLRGKHPREENRTAALLDPRAARKRAYQHAGRFDVTALPYLDNRPKTIEGDQFKFRLTKAGEVYKANREAMDKEKFQALLNSVENIVREMGRDIFAGKVAVAPYRKGIVVACDQCTYQSVCRIDPWTHTYRTLRKTQEAD